MQFRLSRPVDTGGTEREHLVAAWRVTGRRPKEFDGAEIPQAAQPLWEAFLELHHARAVGFAPEPISFSDLVAWQQATGVSLSPWEVSTIRELDRVALRSTATDDKDSAA